MLNEILKKYNFVEFKIEFEALVKECWAGEAYKDKHIKGESKVGGSPDAPKDFVWPEFKGLPLKFIIVKPVRLMQRVNQQGCVKDIPN